MHPPYRHPVNLPAFSCGGPVSLRWIWPVMPSDLIIDDVDPPVCRHQ